MFIPRSSWRPNTLVNQRVSVHLHPSQVPTRDVYCTNYKATHYTSRLLDFSDRLMRSGVPGSKKYGQLLQDMAESCSRYWHQQHNMPNDMLVHFVSGRLIYRFHTTLTNEEQRLLTEGKGKLKQIRSSRTQGHSVIAFSRSSVIQKSIDLDTLLLELNKITKFPKKPLKVLVKKALRESLVAEKYYTYPNRRMVPKTVKQRLSGSKSVILPYRETGEFSLSKLAGKDLKSILLTPNESKDAIYYMAKTLKDIHRRNVVLRDLKPDNMVLDSSGNVASLRVIDLDVAIASEQFDHALKSWTRPVRFQGTRIYKAPELQSYYLSKRKGHSFPFPYPNPGKTMDLFALGLSCCEVLGIPLRTGPSQNTLTSDEISQIWYKITLLPHLNSIQKFVLQALIGPPNGRPPLEVVMQVFYPHRQQM